MKKTAAIITGVLTAAGGLQAKTPLKIFPANQEFETVQALPHYKSDIKTGVKVYTAKILKESAENINDYVVFDKPVTVKKDLYAYSTQKTENQNITEENENSVLFLENVKFERGAAINLRTNMDERLSDFINFHCSKVRKDAIICSACFC